MRFAFLLPFLFASSVFAKPFHRVLVVSAGGITPGVSLGIIHGAEAAGFKPDLIISICGATLGATLARAIPNPKEALEYARSTDYQHRLLQLAQIETNSSLALKAKLDDAEENDDVIPNLFSQNVMTVPEKIGRVFRNEDFPTEEGRPRHIFISSRASFGPKDVGTKINGRALFKEVFITDAQTAQVLRGIKSPMKKLYPKSRLSSETDVVVGVPMSQASRSSIADPFFINPGKIGDSYYFTGAVDLFPIDLANQLGDEVLITYPDGVFGHYPDVAMETSFGFSQTDRSYKAAHTTNVKWIDVSGMGKVTFDPVVFGLLMISKIPYAIESFVDQVNAQYRLGYERAVEAVRLQRTRNNVRSHLRSNMLLQKRLRIKPSREKREQLPEVFT